MRTLLLSLLLCSTFSARAANIAYDFSYAFSSTEVLSGQLIGELQADGDTIQIQSFTAAHYQGYSFPVDAPGASSSGAVSLSGASTDFGFQVSGISPAIIQFSNSATFGAGMWVIVSTENLTGYDQEFRSSSWSIAPSVVPLPAAVWFFVSALGCLVAVKRKR